MSETTTDSPLNQAIRSLIATSAKMASGRSWGMFQVHYQAGQIVAVKVEQTYKYPDFPAPPPAGRQG